MAKIAIFGGTGYAGGHIAAEAASRGHHVTSYSRSVPEQGDDRISYQVGSVHDAETVDAVAHGADAIVVAVPGTRPDGDSLVDAVPSLAAAAAAHGTRVGLVGGAGSSLVSPGGPRLLDGEGFPEAFKDEAMSHVHVLDALRETDQDVDWFVVSPAMMFGSFAPGEATGEYRTGGDVMVSKDDQTSEISGADFAKAVVDELEQRKHSRQRFTVGH